MDCKDGRNDKTDPLAEGQNNQYFYKDLKHFMNFFAETGKE